MRTGLKTAIIEKNTSAVLEKIASAARRAGRDPNDIHLIVVTKGHPVEILQAAIAAGARRLGENYVEEGTAKKAAIGDAAGVEWHMIGHIQSRKAQAVCQHFNWVHSLDSLKLARRLDRFSGEFGRRLPVLLECNVSGEESKFGLPAWNENRWEDLLAEIGQITGLANLQVCGLMTMAPFLPDPEEARPYFQRLRRLQEFLSRQLPEADWRELSMGMSADYEVAVEEGATMVRIGQAILGPRPD